ncbi:hypothetical protein ABXJ76_05380 [Methylobacter sp. G7]|uniref:hypothetical protein n=1 Tax=Methylobacter sp. G7 TaxID=3230117 RepID=UPI003D80049D
MAIDLKPKTLAVQIRDTERQLLSRQQGIDIRTATLIRKIHRQLATPATLLLAGGIGFIIGELTKRYPPPKFRSSVARPQTVGTSPLRIVLNLIASARTLYSALSIAWMMKSYWQQEAPDKIPTRQSQPVTTYDLTGRH